MPQSAQRQPLLARQPQNELDKLLEFLRVSPPSLQKEDIYGLLIAIFIMTANDLFYMPIIDEYGDMTGEDDLHRFIQKVALNIGVLFLGANAARDLKKDMLNLSHPGQSDRSFSFIALVSLYSTVMATTSALLDESYDFPARIFIAGLITIANFSVNTLSTRLIERIPGLRVTFLSLFFPPYLIYYLRNRDAGPFLFTQQESVIAHDLRLLVSAVERCLADVFFPLSFATRRYTIPESLLTELEKGTWSGLAGVIDHLNRYHQDAWLQSLNHVRAKDNLPKWHQYSAAVAGLLGIVFASSASAGFFEAPITIFKNAFSELPDAAFWPLMYYLAFIPDVITFMLISKYGGGLYKRAFMNFSDLLCGHFSLPFVFHLYARSILAILPMILLVGGFSGAVPKYFIEQGSSRGAAKAFFEFCAGLVGNGAFYMMSTFQGSAWAIESVAHLFGSRQDKSTLRFLRQIRELPSSISRLEEDDWLPRIDELIPNSTPTAPPSEYQYTRLYGLFAENHSGSQFAEDLPSPDFVSKI